MNRSIGVTISAVVVFVGSALTILFGSFAIFGLFIAPETPGQPPFVKYAGIVGVAVMMACSSWGIASGVGLINQREWARISMLVFSALLLFMCIPALLIVLAMPFPVPPNTENPELMNHTMKIVRICGATFYGGVAALGGWWLYFFLKKSVREQFGGGATAELAPSSGRGRPVSITIIAWYMVIGAFGAPLMILLTRPLFPDQQVPIIFFAILLRGWRGETVIFCLTGVQLIAAVGLLRLRPWGRTLAIWVQVFFLFNCAISFVIPGNRAKFQQIIAAMQPAYLQASGATTFPMWAGVIASVPIILVILWFLVTRKQAFLKNEEAFPPVPQG